ncbi:ribose ABC transporter permease [Aliifodinibius sp. S!AR15-10]|uniref:ABC transporter permease n=1 Tax=Aliifodinibius sp. S!AR15-10 TaxID=2950437 RepID=UPI00285D1B57|nr:ribose ABC transporter permease [Aliifodinibius sp. S!AR15-10]MDR8389817.1 ribose ABC transporter permease [Aliifodinibius sp. S!AR15-10]
MNNNSLSISIPGISWQKFQSLIAILLLSALLAMLTDNFLTTENLWNVLRQISVNVCISVGLTLVILTAGIDLSVGSVLAFGGAVTAGLLKNGVEVPAFNLFLEFTVMGAIIAGLSVSTFLGWINGIAVTKLRIPSFIATLAMLTMARGLTMLWTGGFPITGLGDSFTFIGTGWLLGMPMPVWITAVVVGLAMILTNKTKLGRYIYAIGDNEEAAYLSGINVKRVKMIVYSLGGLLAGVGGLIVTARLDSAQPNAGFGYELDAIAAVVIGGTSLYGGRGTIMGAVLGALLIGVLNNGLVLLNVSPFWQQVIKGLVILIAVGLDRFQAEGTE